MTDYRENDLYRWLTALTANNQLAHPGDDCAVLEITSPPLLLTVDSLVYGVHYDKYYSSEEIAQKIITVNLSDIAAMGGKPLCGLVSYSGSRPPAELEKMLARIITELKKHGAEIIGGDTTGTADPTQEMLSLTLVGQAAPDGILTRDSGKPGDIIAVSSRLGAPAAVLKTSSSKNDRLRKYLYQRPNNLRLGAELLASDCRCAIDISDGLLLDLQRLSKKSGVGAIINPDSIPIHQLTEELLDDHNKALQTALGGGEEYCLLAAIPPGQKHLIQQLNLYEIGRLTTGTGIKFSRPLPFSTQKLNAGYDHFLN